ncbi:hypothetical protein [uncultured Shimia sp.]|uniref:hypothetical protein n=1 Tax=uncultured Shimia sp. TaxID=573152 RepID=UPI002617EF58|nr:hypothetical protein [uncultured Shimia sp.]
MSKIDHYGYFELLKSTDDPVLPFLEKVTGDGYVHFNPAHQVAFLERLDSKHWTLIAGRFNAADQGVREVLNGCKLFTIVQNPIERFYASYQEARTVRTHPLYEKYSNMSAVEAAQYCIDEGLDYGRNSQCSALTAGAQSTAAAALESWADAFSFVACADKPIQLLNFLKQEGVLPAKSRAKLKIKAPYIRKGDRDALRTALEPAVAEDLQLYEAVRTTGGFAN